MLFCGILKASLERLLVSRMTTELQELLLLDMKKTIESLREEIVAQREEQRQQAEEFRKIIANKDEEIAELRRKLFSPSSEKSKISQVDGQLLLSIINEAEYFADSSVQEPSIDNLIKENSEKKKDEEPKPRKPKAKREDYLSSLPITKVILELPEEERVCELCESQMVHLGMEIVREELRIIPATFERVQYIRESCICPQCKEEDDEVVVKKAATPTPLIPHSLASPSFVSHIISQKYANAMPLYRQEKELKNIGVPIKRATLANWVNTCAIEYFTPIYDYMHESMLKREVLMSDETTCQVLKEEGRKATTTSYMWVHRTGNDGLPAIILYDYQVSRNGDHAVRFLGDFAGYHQCDGFSGYNKLKNVIRCGCLAHVRRKFFEAIPKSKSDDALTIAEQGVAICDILFEKEREFKDDTPEVRKQKRLEQEKPVLEAFWCWIEKQNPPKGSKLAKAINYAKNQHEYLENYLLDGRCSISNNLTENSVRPYVLIRKNSLFHDTPKGATASAIICSLMETAKYNNIAVKSYIELLLTKMPDYNIESEGIEKLMPWSDEVKKLCTIPNK